MQYQRIIDPSESLYQDRRWRSDMTVDQLKTAKYESGLSCEAISEKTGVPLSTVQKVFSGVTKRPRAETLRRLSSVFSPT